MQKENILSGINIEIDLERYYPYGTLRFTILGYISYISFNNQGKYEELGYDVSSDKIGISEIEGAFENYLVGKEKETKTSVDTYGSITEEIASNDAVPGNNLELTIDANLQYTAEKSLQEILLELQAQKTTSRGSITTNATSSAVVVQEVNTGKLLGMARYPYFDFNVIY